MGLGFGNPLLYANQAQLASDSSGVVEVGMSTLHSVSLQSCNYVGCENRKLLITM